jgi:hypothetical protein
MTTIFPFLKTPSVSFYFVKPNSNGTYTLNVEFKNVTGKYRFFVTDPSDGNKMHELFNHNKFPNGGHVMVAPVTHTFYLLCGPGLAKLETRLGDKDYENVVAFNELLEQCRNPENGCKVVEENVAVDSNRNKIYTGKEFDSLVREDSDDDDVPQMGGSKSRKSRKSRKHCNRKSRKHCNRKSRKHCNRKHRRR